MKTEPRAFIRAEGLTKRYIRRVKPESGGITRLWKREKQAVEALTDVSFRVERGELVGLIGPNGAGKSTTVKLLSGILTPSAGQCEVDGRVPWLERREHVRHLGAVFGQRAQLWWDVPIRDSFALLRDVYGLSYNAWRGRLDELTDALDLDGLMDTPLRQLSLGQRMRAELCGSLLHEPELLFLDEPTIGLDAVSKLKLRDFLREENRRRGTTILLTTHDMEDMLALCSRVMVLGHGRLLYDGALDALLRHYDTEQTLRCLFEDGARWETLPPGVQLAWEGEEAVLTYAPSQVSMEALLQAVMRAGRVRALTLGQQNTDAVIARMYKEMKL